MRRPAPTRVAVDADEAAALRQAAGRSACEWPCAAERAVRGTTPSGRMFSASMHSQQQDGAMLKIPSESRAPPSRAARSSGVRRLACFQLVVALCAVPESRRGRPARGRSTSCCDARRTCGSSVREQESALLVRLAAWTALAKSVAQACGPCDDGAAHCMRSRMRLPSGLGVDRQAVGRVPGAT